uniref:tRNA(Ile)-lysidine synthase, chloroplastic n=1 Tax=Dermonema virens TaxID=1077399 RepID=A0A1G4NRL0_9FLOR|nr:tRNA Ile-lysidine synthetase [Dermonema virens]SCW21290.1 tRNA Ile-lysidine synthetase [Dermonema virens]
MCTFLHQKLIHNLCSILDKTSNRSILLALSSGQDSLCLLKLTLDLRRQLNLKIGVIHIDHQCRSDSTHNTKHLLNIIQNVNIESYIYQIKSQNFSEKAFRELRYELFLKTALNNGYNIIATAHTLSDRIETCLFNMIKGGSLDNINSLIPIRHLSINLRLIRPMLNFERSEITWLCRHYYLPTWFDYTNINYNYSRNRIRHEIIPYIKQYYKTNIEKSLSEFVDNISYDSEYLRQNTVKVYLKVRHPELIAINYHLISTEHTSLQRRVLQLFLAQHLNINLSNKVSRDILTSIKIKKTINMKHVSIDFCNKLKWIYIY